MKAGIGKKLTGRSKKEVIAILMESAFYFELSLKERDSLIESIILKV
ncbi:MAG: hypothetical protein JSV21_05555 [Nitrospirota bacterium]|nr:MAG: hypothetical protein JSV21_05555 [Nitrospirota bacterium]